jgi:phospholipid/cholesterol/gamma-HCH transport system substrate-binding protein
VSDQGSSGATGLVGALILGLGVVAAVILLSGGSSYEVTAEFENAGQIVPGNEVVVGGHAAGSVQDIDLGPEGQALITFTVDEPFAPLREGTTVTIRSPSLSQVAGRQLQLTLPPSSEAGDPIPSGERIASDDTVAAVDVDQIFNMLDRRTVRNFKRVIQGFERSTEGVAPQANRGFKYLNPMLSTSRRVFTELSADDAHLEQLLVNASRLSGALADRAPDLSQMVGNLNRMMNALGDRRNALAESIRRFPPFMRSANTTFVNLRAALDDVEPLVEASIPTARALRPFLAELRVAARDAVPTLRDFSTLIKRPGRANDLIDLQSLQPRLARRALGTGSPDCGPGAENPEDLMIPADGDFTQGAFGESICSLTNGEYNLEFFRAYAPELVGWFDTFSHSGYVDALGGVARVQTSFNTFTQSAPLVPDFSQALTPAEQLAAMTVGYNRRCPGGNERPPGEIAPGDNSVPFTDGGHLTSGVGQCDPSQVAPGK